MHFNTGINEYDEVVNKSLLRATASNLAYWEILSLASSCHASTSSTMEMISADFREVNHW